MTGSQGFLPALSAQRVLPELFTHISPSLSLSSSRAGENIWVEESGHLQATWNRGGTCCVSVLPAKFPGHPWPGCCRYSYTPCCGPGAQALLALVFNSQVHSGRQLPLRKPSSHKHHLSKRYCHPHPDKMDGSEMAKTSRPCLHPGHVQFP